MDEWIEEFLFRGRPPSGPGSDQAPTFQVTIGQQQPNPFDLGEPPVRRLLGPLSPDQAAAAGWPLSRLVEGVNTAAIALAHERHVEAEGLRTELDTAVAAIADRDALVERLQKRLAAVEMI